MTLPENVHVFPVGRVESLDLVRGGETIARVQGTSCREDGDVDARGFHRDAHGLFTIGVAHGTSDSAGHEGDRVHYMALGGRHQQQTVDEQPGIAHYCGTPQGRGPHETGPHGCTVVTVDETGRAKTQFVATDTVRWIEQALEVTATTQRGATSRPAWSSGWKSCRPSIRASICSCAGTIRGTGPLVNRLRPGSLADELLVDLRRKFGERSPFAWSVSIDCDSPLSVPAEWYDQETVPRRLPAAKCASSSCTRTAVRPAAIPARRRPRRIRWNRIATIDSRRSARRTAVPRRRSSASTC